MPEKKEPQPGYWLLLCFFCAMGACSTLPQFFRAIALMLFGLGIVAFTEELDDWHKWKKTSPPSPGDDA